MPISSEFVSDQLRTIFEAYIPKILDDEFNPCSPQETLYARAAAVYLLTSNEESVVEKARSLISKTSKDQSDLARLTELSKSIMYWDSLNVLSEYQDQDRHCCEYKLKFRTNEGAQTSHQHAKYLMKGDTCVFETQHPPLIRVIGDPILHQPGIPFPEHPTEAELAELKRQIKIAKEVLIATGGGGIAANQCAQIEKPYQFAIVGVFADERHQTRVRARYPDANFPEAIIMINPTNIRKSIDNVAFNHGCLSVPGPLRAEIATASEIELDYMTFNEDGELVRKSLKAEGMPAIVLQHELNHILHGETYVDVCMPALPSEDLTRLHEVLDADKQAGEMKHTPDLTQRNRFFKFVEIDASGHSHLQPTVLKEALDKCVTAEAKEGVRQRATRVSPMSRL